MVKTGLKHIVIARGTYDGGAPTYGASSTLAVLKAISAVVTLNRDNASLYYDNHKGLAANGVTGAGVQLDAADVPLDDQVTLFGFKKSEDGVYSITDADAPYCGCGWVEYGKNAESGVNELIAKWMYRVQFSLNEDGATTRGESTEFRTATINGDAMFYTDDDGVDYFIDMKPFAADQESAAIAWVDAMAANGQ